MVKDDSRRYGHLDIVSFFLILGCAVACSSSSKTKRSTQNSELTKFDQVQLGLPANEVVRLLGEPTGRYTKGSEKSNYLMFDSITVKIDENSKVAAKGVEISDKNLTLAALEQRYGVKDLELVKTVVGCSGPEEKLGADVYRSKELGAEISVSFKGDIQRFVQNDEIKRAPAGSYSRPVCRVKR